MEKLTFKLEAFEGPLDLILSLISKHKLNIYDIEISKLLEQYLSYINRMQSLNMEVAAEFLEMASRLVHIKTVMLLPKHEDEQEQLKQELTGQLLEYQACKLAAAMLAQQNCGYSIFVRRPEPIDADNTYTLSHNKSELYMAYADAIGKGKRHLPPPAAAFTAIVAKRIVSVSSRIIFILKSLYRTSTVKYSELFANSSDKSEMVATFLALLELVKAKRLVISENCESIAMNKNARDKHYR
ncbi:MAG TPA: serine protease [Ruminococcaceae bacterium]|nr:serine protease [Oscillospiraceae bacterium]